VKEVFKVLIDPDSDHLIGAAYLAEEGGELMSMLQIAMMGKLLTRNCATVFLHTLPGPNLSIRFLEVLAIRNQANKNLK
jgi:pyruvate/2-oxoglutarate dehydrogenase complex dihydrolipoamide dehydrogenase (E3) component